MKPYALTLLVGGQLGEIAHHYRLWPFWADWVGETFGLLCITGILLVLFLVEDEKTIT